MKSTFDLQLTEHTRRRATGKGKRNPDNMDRKMLPGIAND